MKWAITIATLLILCGCASSTRNFSLDDTYGSLAYVGSVQRTSDGANFFYTVKRLHLTFNDNKNDVNATSQIAAPEVCFVTTVKPHIAGRWPRTFNTCVRTQVYLDARHSTATLNDIKFIVPRTKVASSDNAGLSIIDTTSRIDWPLHEDLRG